jgi:hypothetical protein
MKIPKSVVKLQQFIPFKLLISITMGILVISCTSKDSKKQEEEPIITKKRINPNAEERAREFADKNPIFSTDRNRSVGGAFEFSSSNILWRASLESLDGLPLANTDYAGGVIITDWYGGEEAKQIKITVRFLSNELATSSLKVVSYIKECKNNNCTTVAANENFNSEIQNKIMNNARKISIENEKNKK